MAHAQHFLGMNAWVPTVRESNKTSSRPAPALPRIATAMGLAGQHGPHPVSDGRSSALVSPTHMQSAVAPGLDCSRNECSSGDSDGGLPDTASYRQQDSSHHGDAGRPHLQRNSLSFINIPEDKTRNRTEIEAVDSVASNMHARRFAFFSDGTPHHPKGSDAAAKVESGKAPIGPQSSSRAGVDAALVPRSPVAYRPKSPPWFDPARAAQAGFKGRITFHIGSPRSSTPKSRETSCRFEGTNDAGSGQLPAGVMWEALPLAPNAMMANIAGKFARSAPLAARSARSAAFEQHV